MDDPFGPVLIIIVCFLLAAIVRIAAAALPFIDEGELKRQAEAGAPKARRALRLIRRIDDNTTFGEFQMAYCLLLLCACIACCAWLWGGLYAKLSVSLPGAARALTGLCLLVPFALVSFILTGVIPGHLAAHWQQKQFDRVAAAAEWTILILSPVSRFALWLGRLILAPFHIQPANLNELVTEEDILQMVDIGEEKGAIEADEKEMIENIFEFNNMDAGDCMIHRKDITAIDIDSSDDEILETIRESGLSRFPVYEDSIDNVLGILTTRDYLLDRCANGKRTLRQLIRPAHFVPESVRTDVLFQEMQTRKQHMAIVVDEYGGTSGLITLEDLLEEIVGNIYDEFDPKEEPDITKIGDNRWRVSGAAELETVAEALEIDLPVDEEYDTLGGLIFSRLTEIPADGEHPVVECFGLRISVEQIADRRVEWAMVEKLESPKEEEENTKE